MLKNSTISFSSLPVEVKEYFYCYRNIPYWEMQGKDILFICNTTFEYELKNVRWLAWDPHWLLIDKTNNITYRLSYFSNVPTPVIVFDREVFIPTDYNDEGLRKHKKNCLMKYGQFYRVNEQP